MPSTPMTQEEMEKQCEWVSKLAELDISEDDEMIIYLPHKNQKT
jgi:hypothetical protein